MEEHISGILKESFLEEVSSLEALLIFRPCLIALLK
jgi:hypothetical protein